jgi:hypothetical protein
MGRWAHWWRDQSNSFVVVGVFGLSESASHITCIPKYIDVTLSSIKYSFEGCCEMEMDLFDAAVRRFKDIDNRFYERMCVRWRHFFESDFMVKKYLTFSVMQLPSNGIVGCSDQPLIVRFAVVILIIIIVIQ